mgnify:CR=1 FL=1
MSRTSANLILLLAGAIWGMGFIAQQTAMDDIGPILFVALRFLIAGLAVLPIAYFELKKSGELKNFNRVRTHSKGFLIVGLMFFLGMVIQQIGLLETTVTNTAFLTALYVVFVPIFMIVIFRIPQPFIIWPTAILALAGIYLLSGGDLNVLTSGDRLIILCAVFWAGHVIFTGKYSAASGLPVTLATMQFFITAILAFVCYLLAVTIGYSQIPSLGQLIGATPELLYAGIIAGGLGFTLQAIGQRYTSESTAAILISTESLFAAVLGAAFLGERLALTGYIGCAVIFSAILIVQLVPAKSAKDLKQTP